MKDIRQEINDRVNFIKNILKESKADGIVFGNSGGKDSALVGILCKKACENVLGIIMPCGTSRNYNQDKEDAIAFSRQYKIDYTVIDLGGVKDGLIGNIEKSSVLTDGAKSNIAPRLRMTTLYAVARAKNCLVAGTGNKSENYMGYFTKWGDGAYDFNPIADLTVTEIYEFLKYLGAPQGIITKAPSGGLYEGQTDEAEMGVSYGVIDSFLATGSADEKSLQIIKKAHASTEHKRRGPAVYGKSE